MKLITGKVIYGIQKGRTLGFPTANINIDKNLEIGIYAGHIIINEKKYNCAVYSPGEKKLEAFIFDFSEDIYGKNITIEIIKKIRDKKTFKNNAEAIKQITKDVLEAKKYLSE